MTMAGSLSKYWRIQNDRNGLPLHWPGTIDGFPLRGRAPPLTTQQEYEKIPLVYDASGQIFALPEQLPDYLEVIDRCANGWWVLRQDQFLSWDAKKQTLYRFVQWLEIHGEVPNAKSPVPDSAQLADLAAEPDH